MKPKPSRRSFLAGAACASAASLLAVAAGCGRKPLRNIVFFLTDDQRFDALSLAGNPLLSTPNIDRIGLEGAWFRNSFVTTAVCSPSRATMLTGQYAHSHGVVVNGPPVPSHLVTFAQVLQRVGYRCGWFGKWHLGTPLYGPTGWEEWFALKGQGRYENATFTINGEERDLPGYVTDVITDAALGWLKQQEGGRPFFLTISHKAPHHPFQPAPRHRELLADQPPATPEPEGLDIDPPEWMKRQRYSQHGSEAAFNRSLSWEEIYLNYYRTLPAVDEGVGRVMEQLARQGLLDSTLIVYTSDNGYLHGEHGLIDKRVFFEPSIRIPLLMRCPELIPAGTVIDEMALNLDLPSTFVDVAGVAPPRSFQGQSLLPLARGERPPWRKHFFYEYFFEPWTPPTPTLFGVRTERWKYAEPYGVWDKAELYDLETDPQEHNNLIASAAHTTQRQQLAELLKALKQQTGLPEWSSWGGGGP